MRWGGPYFSTSGTAHTFYLCVPVKKDLNFSRKLQNEFYYEKEQVIKLNSDFRAGKIIRNNWVVFLLHHHAGVKYVTRNVSTEMSTNME